MALDRYINRIQIENQRQPAYGQLFTNSDLNILRYTDLIPTDPAVLQGNLELHIYSFYGDYIAGDHDASHVHFDTPSNSCLIDIRESFREANITRGSYLIVINTFQEIWGSFKTPASVVREISPDRT